MSCTCRVCEQGKYIRGVIESRDIDKLIELVEELYEHVMCVETDNEYYENVLKGTWPEGKEILEDAIKLYGK